MTPEKQTEQEKEEAGGGEWREGGKKREKCQSEFLNILFSMEICTIHISADVPAADVPVQMQMTAQVCTNTYTHTESQSEGERQKLSYKAAAVIRTLAPENNHANKHSLLPFHIF